MLRMLSRELARLSFQNTDFFPHSLRISVLFVFGAQMMRHTKAITHGQRWFFCLFVVVFAFHPNQIERTGERTNEKHRKILPKQMNCG